MRILCWQTILMKYHALFFGKIWKISENLSSAAVVIGALRVKNLSSPLCINQSLIRLENICTKYYTIIDFNEVDIRIYLPEKVIIHRGP